MGSRVCPACTGTGWQGNGPCAACAGLGLAREDTPPPRTPAMEDAGQHWIWTHPGWEIGPPAVPAPTITSRGRPRGHCRELLSVEAIGSDFAGIQVQLGCANLACGWPQQQRQAFSSRHIADAQVDHDMWAARQTLDG